MTPEELSRLHPALYHVTPPAAVESILTRGLLSTCQLLDLFEITGAERRRLEQSPRPAALPIHHAVHGTALINDQIPMTEKALHGCLDGGLTPADWLALLNCRVFFWATEKGLKGLLHSRLNRVRARTVLTINTLELARHHAPAIEICPINSGSTTRAAARRGASTFTPLSALPYAEWRRKRGNRTDRIREVTVLGGVPDVARFVTDVRQVEPDT